MPLYEYACLECNERYEDLRSASRADAVVPCTSCGSTRVKRLLSVFATVGGATASSDDSPYSAPRSGGCGCGGNCACRN